MKLRRSSKCHFGKFTTGKKQGKLNNIMKEYSRVVNLFIGKYQKQIPRMKKFDLLRKRHIHSFDTWLSARMIKNAFSEGYGMIRSAKTNAKRRKQNYIRPKHRGKRMILSETIATIEQNPKTKMFDMIVTLGSIGNKMKIHIPLKKHERFNQYAGWNLSKSVTLAKDYIQFTFTKSIEKKNEGRVIALDFGINKFIATSDGETIGKDYRLLLEKFLRKRHGSKVWERCKEELREFIDYHIKNLPYDTYGVVVVEKLSNVHHRMKLKRRLSKNMRRLVSKWAFSYSYGRLMANCDLNRVRYRRVSAYNNSITCPSCGHTDQKNRKTQEGFCCQSCGYSDNADYSSARVALQRFRRISEAYGLGFQEYKFV